MSLGVHQPLCNLGCITSAWLKTFISTESLCSLSEWGHLDSTGGAGQAVIRLSYEQQRKTVTFFLGKMTAQAVLAGI